jgi:hypothetical protein
MKQASRRMGFVTLATNTADGTGDIGRVICIQTTQKNSVATARQAPSRPKGFVLRAICISDETDTSALGI